MSSLRLQSPKKKLVVIISAHNVNIFAWPGEGLAIPMGLRQWGIWQAVFIHHEANTSEPMEETRSELQKGMNQNILQEQLGVTQVNITLQM